MSEIETLDSYDFGDQRPGGGSGGKRWDWDTLLDGDIHKLNFDPDSDPMPKYMVWSIRLNAKKRKMWAMCDVKRDSAKRPIAVILKAVPGTPEQLAKWEAATADGEEADESAEEQPKRKRGKK
jgi:hypothetical protein